MRCRFSGGKHQHMIEMQKNVHDVACWLSPQGVARNRKGCQLLADNHPGWGEQGTIWCGSCCKQLDVVCKQHLRQSKPPDHHWSRLISSEVTSFALNFSPGGRECNSEWKGERKVSGTDCYVGRAWLCFPDRRSFIFQTLTLAGAHLRLQETKVMKITEIQSQWQQKASILYLLWAIWGSLWRTLSSCPKDEADAVDGHSSLDEECEVERTTDPPGAVHLGGLSPNPCSLPHTSQAHPWARPSKSQDCDAMRTRGDGLGHLLGWGLVLMGPRDTDWACCGMSGKTVGPEGWAGFTRKSRRSVEGGGLFLVGGPCWGMEQSHGEDKWCSGGGEEASGHDEAGLSAEPAGLSRLTACGIFLDQGSNLSPLCWQVDSLDHQGSSGALFFKAKHWCRDCQSFCWACHPDRWQRKCGQYEVEKADVICV